MTPFASVAMHETLTLLKTALCKARGAAEPPRVERLCR
jgi:hypothetical protein